MNIFIPHLFCVHLELVKIPKGETIKLSFVHRINRINKMLKNISKPLDNIGFMYYNDVYLFTEANNHEQRKHQKSSTCIFGRT